MRLLSEDAPSVPELDENPALIFGYASFERL